MLRNYNGNVNRSTLRDLKKLCKVNAENFETLSEACAFEGEVSFYTNLDPITGCPDKMSEVITLRNEAEIKDYLKKDFLGRLNGYLTYHKPAEDYLLNALIDFIKENDGWYPSKEKMRQLEITAENKQIAESPVTDSQDFDVKQEMLKEILLLAEEIMESKRENNPEAITSHLEPYPDILSLSSNNNFYIDINCSNRHYRNGDNSDYQVVITWKDDPDIEALRIYSYCDTVLVNAENWLGEELDDPVLIKEHSITIHQSIVKLAEAEGLEFLSEIAYAELSA